MKKTPNDVAVPEAQALTERERELLERYRPMLTDGRVLNERGQERQVRDADPALVADYAARLDGLLSFVATLQQERDDVTRLREALEELEAASRESLGFGTSAEHMQRDKRLRTALTNARAALVVSSPPPGERAAPREASDKKPSDAGEAEA